MLRMKKVSEMSRIPVFTEKGDKFGEVEDAAINNNKIESWRIRVTGDSVLSRTLSGAKGVVVPHQLVKAIGHIMIVAQGAAPSYAEGETEE